MRKAMNSGMRMRRLAMIALAASCAGGHLAAIANDEPLVSPVRSSLDILDENRQPVRNPAPGTSVVLRLTLTHGVTQEPARWNDTRAFVKTLDGEPPACAARVRMYRATGAVALGDHALEGTLILSHSADNRLSLVDPRLPASRNTLAIRTLKAPQARLMSDSARARYFVHDPDTGMVERIRFPDLALTRVIKPDHTIPHLDERGLVLIGANHITRVRDDGSTTDIPLANGPWHREQHTPMPVLKNAAGQLLVIPQTVAERATRFTPPPGARFLNAARDAAIALTSDDMHLHILTARGTAAAIKMAQPVMAAWLTPDKRYAIALHEDRRTVSVIDAAMGEMAQAFSLSMPLLHLHMIDRTGFLQLANGMVLKFDQASLARGQAVALVPVLRPAPDMDMVADELIPPPALMPFGEGILASGHGGDRIARVTMDTHAALNGAPAQSTPTILRTGRSKAMASVKRGFVEIGPGIYEASFMARAHGAHLLVLADAKGQFSACHAIAIDDGDAAMREGQKARLVLVAARSAITVGASRIVMAVEGDAARPIGAVTPFEIMDLSSHWRTRVQATRQSDDTLLAQIAFPKSGRYILQAYAPDAGHAFRTPVIVVVPDRPQNQ
ncbi:MAG: hypothetical protein ACRCTD_05305 [Beijerinckiaceae bacterium]